MINRPQPDEYAPYYGKYIALVGDEPIITILESLKESSYQFFKGLPAHKGDFAYGEGKWTIKEVLGHMMDAERTFAYRVLCFSREETILPGFDQEVYMMKATFNSRPLEELAEEFKAIREANLYLFRALTKEQETQKGIASGNPVSVRALLYMIAGHELHHLNILKAKYLD